MTGRLGSWTRYRDKLFRGGNLYSDTLYTSILVMVGKSFGFFVPFAIPILFGVSGETDVFFFAYSLVLCLMHVSAESLRPVLGPYLAERSHDPEAESKLLSGLMARLSAYLAVFCVAAALVMKPVLTMFGFTPEAAGAARSLFMIGVPIIFFASWGSCLSVAINLRRFFWVTSLAPVLRAAATLLLMFTLHRKIGVAAVMAGFVAGEFAMFLFLWLMARRVCRFRFRLDGAADGAKSFLRSAALYMACAALSSFSPVVDRAMASWTGLGSVSFIQYTATLNFVVFSVLAVGFEYVLASYWSNAFHKAGSRANFRGETLRVASQVFVMAALVCGAAFLARELFVELFFRWGRVSPETVPAVTELFGISVWSLVPAMLIIVFQQYFFVIKRTNALLASYALRFVLNIAVNLLLLRFFGLKGIVISTVIASWLQVTALLLFFRKNGET